MGGNKRVGKAPPSRGADPPQPHSSRRRRSSSSSSSATSWDVNDAESDSSLELEKCGECGVPFNSTNHRRVKDNCGCRKCRACMAESEMECRSCKKPEKKSSSSNLQQTYNTRSKGPVKKKKLSPIPKRRKVMINTVLPKEVVPGCSNKKVPPARSSPDITEETQKTKQTSTSQPSRLKLIIRKKSKKENTAPSSSSDSTPSAAQDSVSTSEEDPIPSTSSSAEPEAKRKRKAVVIFDHITIHPIPNEPPTYECTICGHKFKTKANVKYHEVCLTGKFHFNCETCGQGFISKSHYEYHLRTHTGVRPFACTKCDRRFNQRSKVTRHMLTHTGEKPHKCQECDRGFANNQALRAHMLIHTGERPFPCSMCPKRFTGLTNLKKHMITHTGERPFTCDVCQKSFGLKWTLQLHQKTHTDVRPFACDKCTRSFSNKKDLRRHLITHTGLKPYKCSLCATPFRRKDNLDRHLKKVHKQPKEVAKQLGNEAAAEYLKTMKKQPDDIPASKRNAAVTENIIQNYGLLQGVAGSTSSNEPSTSAAAIASSSSDLNRSATASKQPASSPKKKAKKKKKVDPPQAPNNEAEPLPPGNEDVPVTSNKKLEEKPEEIQKAQEEEECILPHDLDELDKEENESVAPFLASSTIIEPVEPGDEYPLGSREVVIITIQNDLGMREELPVIPVELQPPPPSQNVPVADPTVENKERWSYILESLSDNEYPVEVDEEGDKSTQTDIGTSSDFDVRTQDSIDVGETKVVSYWEGNFVLDGEASLFVSAPAGLREFTVEEVENAPVSAETSCSDSFLEGEERELVEQNAEETDEPLPQSESAVDEQHVEASQVEIVREEREKEGDDQVIVDVNVPISIEMTDEESDLVEEESVEEISDPFSCRGSPSPTPSELGISFDDDPSLTTLDESRTTAPQPNTTGPPSPVECNSPTPAEVVDELGSCSSTSPSRDDAFMETDSRANEEVYQAPISTETSSSLGCLEDEDETLVEDEQSADLCDTEVEDQPPESIAIVSAVDEHVEESQMETEGEEGMEKEDLVPVEMNASPAPDNVNDSLDEDDMVETDSVLCSPSPTPSELGISFDADAPSITLKESRRIDFEPVKWKSWSARRLSVIIEEDEEDVELLETPAQGEQLDAFAEDEQTVAINPPDKEVDEGDEEVVQPLKIQTQSEQLHTFVEGEHTVATNPPDKEVEGDVQPMDIQAQGEQLDTFVEDEQNMALNSPEKEGDKEDVQSLEIQAQAEQLNTFVEDEQTMAINPPDKEVDEGDEEVVQPMKIQTQSEQLHTFVEGEHTVATNPPDKEVEEGGKEDVQPLEIQAQREQLDALDEGEKTVALYPPDKEVEDGDVQPLEIQAQVEQTDTLVEDEQSVVRNPTDKEVEEGVVQPLEIRAHGQQTVAPYAPAKEAEEKDVQPLEIHAHREQLDAFVEDEQTVAPYPPEKEVEEEDKEDAQPLEIQAQVEQLNAFVEDEQSAALYPPEKERNEEDVQPMEIQTQREQLDTFVEDEQNMALNHPEKEVEEGGKKDVQPLEIQAQDQQTVAPYAPDKELEEEDVQPMEIQTQGEQLDTFVEDEQNMALDPSEKEVEEGDEEVVQPLEIQAQSEQLDTFAECEQTVTLNSPDKQVEEDVQPLGTQAQGEQLVFCVEDEQTVALNPSDKDVEEEDVQPLVIQAQVQQLDTLVEGEQTLALCPPDKEGEEDVQPLEIQAQAEQLNAFVEDEQSAALYPPEKERYEEDVQPMEIQTQRKKLDTFVEDEQNMALNPPEKEVEEGNEEDVEPLEIQAKGDQLHTFAESEQTVTLNPPDKEVEEDVQPLEIQAQGEQLDTFVEDEQNMALDPPEKEVEEGGKEDVKPLEIQAQSEQLGTFVEDEQTVAVNPPDKEVVQPLEIQAQDQQTVVPDKELEEEDVQPLEIQSQGEQLDAFVEGEQTVTLYSPDKEVEDGTNKEDDRDQPEETNIVPVSPTGVEQTQSIDNTLLLNSNPEVVKLDESSERLSPSSLAAPTVESQIVHEDAQVEADNEEERNTLENEMEEVGSTVSAKVHEQTENVEGMLLPHQHIDAEQEREPIPGTEEEENVEVAALLAYISVLKNRIVKLSESRRAGIPEEEQPLGAEPASVRSSEEKDEEEAHSIGQEMDCDPVVSSTEEGIVKNIVTLGSHHESVPIPDIPEETKETGEVESMVEEFDHDSCSVFDSVEVPSSVVTVGEEEKLGNETEEQIPGAVEETITQAPAPPVEEIEETPNSTSDAISLDDNAEDDEQLNLCDEVYEPTEQPLREELEESSPDIEASESEDGELFENETDLDTEVDEQEPPAAASNTEHLDTFQVEANGASSVSSPVPVQVNENVGEQLAIENEDESLESVEEMQFEQQEEDDGMETEDESAPQEGNGMLTALCNVASFLIGLAGVAEEVEQQQVPRDEIDRDSAIQVAVEETIDAVVEKVVETETVDFEMNSWVQIETEVVSGEAAELEDLVLCVSPSRNYPLVELDSEVEGEGKAEAAVSNDDDDNETVCSSESEKAPPYSPLSPYPKPGGQQNYGEEGQCSISPPPQEPHVFQASAEADNEEGAMMATELPFPEENYEIVSPPTPQLTIEIGQEEDDLSFEPGLNEEQDLEMISRPAVPEENIEQAAEIVDAEVEDLSAFFWDTFTLKDSTGTQPEENTVYETGFRVAGAVPSNEVVGGKIRYAVFTSKSNQVDDEKDDSDDDQPSQEVVVPNTLYCVTNIRNKNDLRKALECLKRQRQQEKEQEEEVDDDDDDYGRLYIDEGPWTEQQDDIGFNDNPPVPINLGRVDLVEDFDGVVVQIREEGFCPYSSLPYSASYHHHPSAIDGGTEAQRSYLNLDRLQDDIEYPPQEQALDLSSKSQQREMEVAIKFCALLGPRAALEREAFPNSVPLRLSLPSTEDNLEIRGDPLMTPSSPQPPPSGIDLILQASKAVELRIRAESRHKRYLARRLAHLRREESKRIRKQLEAGVADPTGIIGENTRQRRRAKCAIRPVRNFVIYTVHRSFFQLQ